MRVLVTRAEEENQRLAKALQAVGHQVVTSPLTHIRIYQGPPLALEGVQAILLTSANGVRALAARSAQRSLRIFAVGQHTAKVATATGFLQVRHADGDTITLADAVCEWARPEAGVLLHVTGRDRTGSLAPVLGVRGFEVRTEELYAADPLPLTAAAARALREGELDAVMLFSPRSARLFAKEMMRLQLRPFSKNLIAICISEAAARPAYALCSDVQVAERPNFESMLAQLGCA